MNDKMTDDSIVLRQVALRPMEPSGRKFWGLVAILALLVLAAVVAFVIQWRFGLGAAGYTDQSFWSIYEADLVAFIGVSYGGALVSAILRLTQARWRAPITRLAESMAVFSLLAGALFAIIHLGRPERIWELVTRPNVSSPIIWDFVAVTTYLIATLVFLYLPLIPDLAELRDHFRPTNDWRTRAYSALALNWQGLPAQRRVLEGGIMTIAIAIIPIAVLVHSVLSWAFAVTSRPGWHSTIFGPEFVVAALYSGVAMVILVVAGFRRGYHLEQFIQVKQFRYLGFLMLTLDLTYLYLTFSEYLTEGYSTASDVVPVLQSVLTGPFAPSFWLFVVAGGLVPLGLVAIPRTRTVSGIVIASILVVGNMWLKRILIIVPAATHPLIGGAWGVFSPTWIPIVITVGAVAAIPLFLMLFFKVVPILGISEIEEVIEAEETKSEALTDRKPWRALEEGGMIR